MTAENHKTAMSIVLSFFSLSKKRKGDWMGEGERTLSLFQTVLSTTRIVLLGILYYTITGCTISPSL